MDKKPSLLESILVHTVLLTAVGFAIYPILWVVTLAFSAGGLSSTTGAIPLPRDPSLENFRIVTGGGSGLFFAQLGNSLVVSLATAIVAVAIATPAAYALARFEFVGKKAGMGTLLATQMFPTVASAVPLYLLLEALHLLDSRAGLVLVYATTSVPFAIFQLRGSFETIPVELEEAAMVDGLSRTRAFLRITFPLLAPGLVASAVYAFLQAWNEFTVALVVMTEEQSRTLPLWLRGFVQASATRETDWGQVMAASALVAVPVIIFFMIVQGRMSSGLVGGAVKG